MYPEFKFSKKALHRLFCAVLAAFLMAVTIPFANMMNTSAAQITSRSITLSDSSPSGAGITTTPGTGTNVNYNVQFTSASNNITDIVIDFCSESPIVGSTCTSPTAFSVTGATATSTNLVINNTTGTANNTFRANVNAFNGATKDITIAGVTNPSTVGSFYARILLFTTANIGGYTNAATPGTYSDYGGVALSTASTITITAKVQETLSFCVTTSSYANWITTNDCSDPQVSGNLPALTIGHGSPKILDSTAIDSGFIYTQLSTNAINGSVIRLRGSNTCGGLSNDAGVSCSIPGIGNAAQMAAGTANFGLFVANSTPGVNGSVAGVTADANYNDGANTNTGAPTLLAYGMDNTNVPTTYGDTIATSAGPVYRANITNVFGATAALTTPAGIYTNNYSMIATGTF